MVIIIFSIEIIVILTELFYIFIFYKGTVEGNILDCQIKNDIHNQKSFRYTITYLVNGKTYIYQQKISSSNKMNDTVIIKYNLKDPQKSRIKGDNPIFYIAISLLFFTILIFK